MSPEVTPIPKPPKREKRRRRGLKRVSDKRRDEKPERDLVREAVFARDGHCCRIAPFLPDTSCFPPGELTYHHLRKPHDGGQYTEDNGITACPFHNDWVEDHPKEADALGLAQR
jgi:hypothetical protein